MIADVDDCGGDATWSLQVSVQPAHALNMLEIPLVSPALLGWYAVGIVSHPCFELGIFFMAVAKLEDAGLCLKFQPRSVPRYVWLLLWGGTAAFSIPSASCVVGR